MTKLAVTDVDVIIGNSDNRKKGWELVGVDLNKGAGGQYVWLVYYRDPAKQRDGQWVTEITPYYRNSPPSGPAAVNAQMIPTDINAGTDGGVEAQIWVTRQLGKDPVVEVDVRTWADTSRLSPDWRFSAMDLNEGVHRKGVADLSLCTLTGRPGS